MYVTVCNRNKTRKTVAIILPKGQDYSSSCESSSSNISFASLSFPLFCVLADALTFIFIFLLPTPSYPPSLQLPSWQVLAVRAPLPLAIWQPSAASFPPFSPAHRCPMVESTPAPSLLSFAGSGWCRRHRGSDYPTIDKFLRVEAFLGLPLSFSLSFSLSSIRLLLPCHLPNLPSLGVFGGSNASLELPDGMSGSSTTASPIESLAGVSLIYIVGCFACSMFTFGQRLRFLFLRHRQLAFCLPLFVVDALVD